MLFLDELGEFPVNVLDAMRQPMEDGSVIIARKGAAVRFPCRIQVVAATNPCPCGYAGDRLVGCTCTEHAIDRYRRRFSGPLVDRMDLRIAADRLRAGEMAGEAGESSAAIRERVVAARERQASRGRLNAHLARSELDALPWSDAAQRRLVRVADEGSLSARGWDRVRRVARTIADLTEAEVAEVGQVEEALALRGDYP